MVVEGGLEVVFWDSRSEVDGVFRIVSSRREWRLLVDHILRIVCSRGECWFWITRKFRVVSTRREWRLLIYNILWVVWSRGEGRILIDGVLRIVPSDIIRVVALVVLVLVAPEGVVAGAVVVVVSKAVLSCSEASLIVQLGLSFGL